MKTVKNVKAKLAGIFSVALMLLRTCMAYADGTSEDVTNTVLAPITLMKNISIGIVGGAGAIMAIWAIFDIAIAWNSHDNSQMFTGLKKIAGAALCIGISVILSAMGV